jgi:uncharacterized protein
VSTITLHKASIYGFIAAMLIVAGFLTGLIVGLTGVGGGALMTPILLLVFGISPVTAVGTDLWFAAITKLVATRIHSAAGLIDWQVTKRLWAGSLPAAGLTVLAMKAGLIVTSFDLLKTAVAVAVLVTAAGLLLQPVLQKTGRGQRLNKTDSFKAWQPVLTVAAGAGLGVIVTLTSVGAGALGVVMLTYLYPLRLTPARLIATDIVHAIPLALFAGLGHLMVGHVDFELLGWLLLGSIPGVFIGAKLSSRLPARVLRIALALVLCAVAIKLLGS